MVSSFLTAEKDDKTFRLLLLGSAGVGKTGEIRYSWEPETITVLLRIEIIETCFDGH